jgi:hypothetical protein
MRTTIAFKDNKCFEIFSNVLKCLLVVQKLLREYFIIRIELNENVGVLHNWFLLRKRLCFEAVMIGPFSQ